MTTRRVTATEFKAKCLTLLDEVAEKRESLVVTKRGKPVARVMSVQEPRSLIRTARQLVSDEELIKPLYEDLEPDWPE
jgi:prevent-host-death family protein